MKNLLLLGSLLLTTSVSSAQNMMGVATSRYGGTNRLYVNPAFAADSPSRFYVNVGMGSAHVNNNYVRYQAPFSLMRLISNRVPAQYRNPDGSLRFDVNYTDEILDDNPKNGTIWGEVRGPAFLTRGNWGAFAVTTRLRAVAQVKGASESLLSAVRAGLSDGVLYGIPNNDNQFSANTNTFSELAFTYSNVLWEGETDRLLLGVTAKGLLGYNAQHLINRGLDYRIAADPDNPNSAFLEVNRLDAKLAYTTFLQNRPLSPRTLLSTNAPGRGIGLDLGLSYIYQPDPYGAALRLGVAITDIGGLSYRGDAYTYNDAAENPIRFRSSDFNNVGNSTEIIRTIQNKLNTGRNPSAGRFRAGLPTSLNLTADYAFPKGLGLNVTYLQDVRSQQATAIHQPTLLAVTPRYETRWVSVSMPVTYLNRGLTAGAMVRVGPGWIGTDNFFGLIGNASNGIRPRGLDVYGGVAFGIGRIDEEE
ncbi:DUF5723 family protein [Spirosoma montaniterrae]|uniref:DUF5723 domain-containing protein n=1 Tax=Spirosoma montaniterrae TaxID=1178516 RepID=A0A1P9WXA6_9BACT|nr:DUF5723 family protein [Spirosoma montaniterrae]AQG80016.1 hypothetical protein AWR27_12175 [Spirosoma montaniterrae]